MRHTTGSFAHSGFVEKFEKNGFEKRENIGGRSHPSLQEIVFRVGKRFMQSISVLVVEVIPVHGQKLNLGTLGKIGRFVQDQPAVPHLRLEPLHT